MQVRLLSLSMLTSHVFTTYSKKRTNRSQALNSRFYQNNDFIIYFLNKEVFYTKLKYSRVPQFDTSSGAAASFLSGLYGFMVCERFGFELIDSGDFLFAVLYILASVFLISFITTFINANVSWGLNIKTLLISFK